LFIAKVKNNKNLINEDTEMEKTFKECKAEIKAMAKALGEMKQQFREFQRKGSQGSYTEYDIKVLKWAYRHRHIAYTLAKKLRGESPFVGSKLTVAGKLVYAKIENKVRRLPNGQNNIPDWDLVCLIYNEEYKPSKDYSSTKEVV